MTKAERRRQVIEACMALLRHTAATARQEMDSAQQQSNDYGANVDRYDSFRTKMMRQRDMYAKQLSNANAGLRVMEEMLRTPPPVRAEHGAIVITDRQGFFMSAGIGRFLVPFGGAATAETFFAISAQTPVYMALKGKRMGDTFTINGVTQTIREIF